MTQTTTDYLFKLTAPPAERSYGTTSSGGAGGAFDNHLSQASSRTDDSRGVSTNTTRTDAPRYNDSPSERDRYRDDSQSRPIEPARTGDSRHDEHPSSTASTQQADTSDRVDEVKAEEVDHELDDDKCDETTDAVCGQVAGDSRQHANAKTNGTANGKRQLAEKSKAAAEIGDDDGTQQAANNTSTKTADAKAQLVVQDESPGNGGTEILHVETTEVGLPEIGSESSDVTESNGRRPKLAKSRDSRGKQAVNGNENKADITSDEKANAAKNVDDSINVASATTSDEQASLMSAETPAADDRSENTATADDLRSKSRQDGRSDSAAAVGKSDAAQLVNSVANTSVGGATNSSKNDRSAKPAGPTGEPAAAALERISRPNAGANRSASSGEANDGPRVDPTRFVARVAKAFHTAQERGGTLQLRLSPPELGALRLELTVKDGVMSAALQTENANARRLLLDHLPALRDRLAEQNIRVDRFDVDVRRDGTESQADTRGSRHQQFQQPSEQPTPRRQSAAQSRQVAQPQPQVRSTTPTVSDNGLNLIV